MENQISLLFLFSALFLIWIFYNWFYWQYRVEKTRQDLFFTRNELFDYAAQGNISFDHPAYGMLRQLMNSMIRFTHKFDLITTLCLFFGLRNIEPDSGKLNRLMEEIEKLPTDTKETFSKYMLRMDMILVSHLIKSSIILMTVVVYFGLSIVIKNGWHNLKDEVKKQLQGRWINQIDSIAAELG